MISIFNLSNDNGYKSTKKSDKLITFWYEKFTNNKVITLNSCYQQDN